MRASTKNIENNMKQDFDPNRHAMWMTNRIQAEIHDLVVEGVVPAELNGIFCTVGPESAFLPKPQYEHVPIHGDGMLSSVRIRDGKATYKSKFVMSEKLKAEMAAGKAVFGAYRNPWTDDPGMKELIATIQTPRSISAETRFSF